MSANGGEIVLQLALEDGKYKVGVLNAGNLMREFERSVKQTAASVKKLEQHQESLGRKFRDLVITMGNLRFVAMDINDVFLRLPMSILRTAGEVERLQQLMTGLSKETERAARQAEGLKAFNFVTGVAKNAPFDISALADSYVKLRTAGIDPTNGSMQALVDSVARFGGTGETLKRASIAIQQMAGKGVISMEELRQQLGEAVPTAMQDMADSIGISLGKLTQIISKGTLTAGPALEKMLARMAVNNMGAAEEMMNTWTGMTARLKTEWELASKYIADAGFADSAKKAISELISFLSGDSFKSFAIGAGLAMANTVEFITTGTKVLIEYGSWITTAAKAWLGYKLVFSLIAPLGRGVEQSFRGITGSIREQIASAAESAAANQRRALAEASASLEIAQARRKELSEKLNADRQELASVRAKNAQILAEDARLHAELAAMRAKEEKFGVNNIGAQQRVLRDLDNLSRANSQLIARERELATSVIATGSALNATNVAVVNGAAHVQQLSNVTRAQSIAAAAATIAQRGFNTVLSALGGWVGVAIMALSSLVMWYQNASRAADKLAEAKRRANEGVADEESLKLIKEELQAATEAYEIAESAAKSKRYQRGVFSRDKTPEEIEEDANRLKAALQRKEDAMRAHQRAMQSIIDRDAGSMVAGLKTETDRAIRDADAATSSLIRAVQKRREEFIKANKDSLNADDLAKRVKVFTDEENAIFLKGLQDKIAIVEKIANNAKARVDKAGIGSAERVAYEKVIEEMTRMADDFRKQMSSKKAAFDMPITFTDGGKGKGAADKLEKMIIDLEGKRDGLEAALEGFEGLEGKADKAGNIIAQLRRDFEGGLLGDNKSPARQARFKHLIDLVEEIDGSKEKLAKLQTQAQDMAKVKAFADQLTRDTDEALEIMNEPLTNEKRGPQERAVDKIFARYSDALAEFARKSGKALETLRKEWKGQAATIDITDEMQKMAKETVEINSSIVQDSRQAARAKMEAENQRHEQYIRNLIEEGRASGKFSEEETTRMNKILEDNMVARARKVEMETKGPIDRMVDNWKNATANMEEASVGWANASVDAFTEFAMTGKFQFRDLANSIIKDLIRISIQRALVGLIVGLGAGAASAGASASAGAGAAAGGPGLKLNGPVPWKFADGGIMTSMGALPLKKYAAGGIANSPQLTLFGEGRTPEAFVPLPDGRTIPVTMKGDAGAGAVNISIVVNKSGSETTTSTGNEAESYRAMADRIKGVVREELSKEIRPGGMLYR